MKRDLMPPPLFTLGPHPSLPAPLDSLCSRHAGTQQANTCLTALALAVPSALSTLLGIRRAPSLASSTPSLSPPQGGPLLHCFRSQPHAAPPPVMLPPSAPAMSDIPCIYLDLLIGILLKVPQMWGFLSVIIGLLSPVPETVPGT